MTTTIKLTNGALHDVLDALDTSARAKEPGTDRDRIQDLQLLIIAAAEIPTASTPVLIRTEVLDQARAIVTGDRQADYGDATESFSRIAELWTATLGQPVTPTQVALCLLQLKVARAINNPQHRDSWVDMAGYAALGAEVSDA